MNPGEIAALIASLIFGITGLITGIIGLWLSNNANKESARATKAAEAANELAEQVKHETDLIQKADLVISDSHLTTFTKRPANEISRYLTVTVMNAGEIRAHKPRLEFGSPGDPGYFNFVPEPTENSRLRGGQSMEFACEWSEIQAPRNPSRFVLTWYTPVGTREERALDHAPSTSIGDLWGRLGPASRDSGESESDLRW